MTDADLDFAAKTYSVEQLEPKALACIKNGCPSYVHCMMGEPRKDGSGMGYALPVCSYAALRRKREKVIIRPTDVGNVEDIL